MKTFTCDNCGKAIESDRYILVLGRVNVDENEVEADLCPECAQKLKKKIKDGFS